MEKNALKEQSHEVEFDWDGFMKFLLETPGELKKVHFAWPLFCDIARNVDHTGLYINTYLQLARCYGVATITVKKWRQHLFKNLVIESYSRGRSMAFRLLPPYQDFIREAQAQELQEGQKKQSEEIEDLMTLKHLLLKTVKNESLKNKLNSRVRSE